MGLSPEQAVGLILLPASPGWPTANLYSHLDKGDIALNITLMGLNNLFTFHPPLLLIFRSTILWVQDK